MPELCKVVVIVGACVVCWIVGGVVCSVVSAVVRSVARLVSCVVVVGVVAVVCVDNPRARGRQPEGLMRWIYHPSIRVCVYPPWCSGSAVCGVGDDNVLMFNVSAVCEYLYCGCADCVIMDTAISGSLCVIVDHSNLLWSNSACVLVPIAEVVDVGPNSEFASNVIRTVVDDGSPV